MIIDSREPKQIQDAIKNKIEDVKIDFLSVGDYLLDNGYAIERKDKDLVQSILSNRLYDQLNNLCQYEHPILCITLQDLWKTFYYSRSRYIHRSYIGTLTTLTAKYPNLKLIYLQDEQEFVDYIVSLHKKLTENKKSERPAPIMRRSKKIQIRMENALTTAEGISVGYAKKFLKHYNSLEELVDASIEDMMKIDGVGKSKAESVYKLLHSKYKK